MPIPASIHRLKQAAHNCARPARAPPSEDCTMRMIASVVLLCLSMLQVVFADEPALLAGQISVREVSASRGALGGTSRLLFIITNDGIEAVHFIGVRSDVAGKSVLIGRVGALDSQAFGSFSIEPDEALNLSTSHRWVSLRSLLRPLVVGDSFPVTLMFKTGELSVLAHVHP